MPCASSPANPTRISADRDRPATVDATVRSGPTRDDSAYPPAGISIALRSEVSYTGEPYPCVLLATTSSRRGPARSRTSQTRSPTRMPRPQRPVRRHPDLALRNSLPGVGSAAGFRSVTERPPPGGHLHEAKKV